MEIYNEEINDLLAVENNKLPIHESLEVAIHSLLSSHSFLWHLKTELTWLSL